jgi:hypothetical protein
MPWLKKSKTQGLTLARENVNAVYKNARSIHSSLIATHILLLHRLCVLESAENILFPPKSLVMPSSKKSRKRPLTWARQNATVTIYGLIIDEHYVGDIQGVPIVLLRDDLTQEG